MSRKNPITWLLSVGTIIDEKETSKTGLGLIFVGVLFIIIGFYMVLRDFSKSDFNLIYIILFILTGFIILIVGVIFRREYFLSLIHI